MKKTSAVIILIASLAMIASLFLPLWNVFLEAPQYPEGLVMQIWLNHLSGDVNTISNLNHYIGMRHIEESMFPEFQYMRNVVIGFIVFGVVVSLLRKKWLYSVWFLAFLGAAVLGIYDFWHWEYDYGHNLSPTAPIKIPGMSYQPPLLGSKQLLNFNATSYPAWGGLIIMTAGALGLLVFVYELFLVRKKVTKKMQVVSSKAKLVQPALVACLLPLLLLSSCSMEPQPISYGKDACDFCRMTITDSKFSGEILTKKGKAYKFDSIECMVHYINANQKVKDEIGETLVNAYSDANHFLIASSAVYLKSEKLKSPMGEGLAAWRTKDEAGQTQQLYGGVFYSWNYLLSSLQ